MADIIDINAPVVGVPADNPRRKLTNFIASFKTDIARPNRFDVMITRSSNIGDGRQLKFRCENAELPGRTLATYDLKIGANPVEKYPYHVSFNDLTLTFIVSDDMYEKKFFEEWIDSINYRSNWNYEYKDAYSSTISIKQYDVTNIATYEIELYEAFPIAINQLDLDWSADGHHKLSVVFAYTKWQQINVTA